MYTNQDLNRCETRENKWTQKKLFSTICSTKDLQKASSTLMLELNSSDGLSKNVFLEFGSILLNIEIKRPQIPPKSLIAQELSSKFSGNYDNQTISLMNSRISEFFSKKDFIDITEDLESQRKLGQDVFNRREYIEAFIEDEYEMKKIRKWPIFSNKRRKLQELESKLKSIEEKIKIDSRSLRLILTNLQKETNEIIHRIQLYSKGTAKPILNQTIEINQEITELFLQHSQVADLILKDSILMEITRKSTKLAELRTEHALHLSEVRKSSYNRHLKPTHSKSSSLSTTLQPLLPESLILTDLMAFSSFLESSNTILYKLS